MKKCTVMLDPYSKEVTMLYAGKVTVRSYQQAITIPKFADTLPSSVITTICNALKPAH